eukprot:2653693-Heterocapsa_arctica.AAC.1
MAAISGGMGRGPKALSPPAEAVAASALQSATRDPTCPSGIVHSGRLTPLPSLPCRWPNRGAGRPG